MKKDYELDNKFSLCVGNDELKVLVEEQLESAEEGDVFVGFTSDGGDEISLAFGTKENGEVVFRLVDIDEETLRGWCKHIGYSLERIQ
ncbi:hypothetical protein [uncultured Parasutterella sp.]|uniref:hypothetical protein n=1 Tax=uncultured Parasutterella sp. TaxID=1263098 RepID=UPI00259584DB|nr:hypothetical protein [uncultured Parasutterella sp.]